MKKLGLLILSFVFLSVFKLSAQDDPVKWKYTVNKLSDCEVEVVFTATVEAHWHLYSQENPPYQTYFEFKKAGNYKLIGKTTEPTPVKENDEYLGPIAYFKESVVVFKQKIAINSNDPFKITGEHGGQVCITTEDGRCLPYNKSFSFDIDPKAVCLKDPNDIDGDGTGNKEDKCPDIPGLKELGGCPDTDSDGIADTEDKCPEDAGTKEKSGCPDENTAVVNPVNTTNGGNCTTVIPEKLTEETLARFTDDCGTCGEAKQDKSFWGIFIAGFIGGLLALLMPCIFPMIPMTVSFFTKQSKTKAKGIVNASIYAASIIVIYTALGLLVTVIAGPTALNNMSTSAFWNILFFVVFIVFAASFLGAFEIVLPSKLVNAVDKGSNKGGLIGIFFMAFTLSLVSFSCTGPIIGSLLVEAAQGKSYLGPAIGMFGFSLALAIPFALFAAFPGWLQSLPKSGGWLNSIKVVLGFAEIALAFKFLSTVDLTQHWGFLKREIYIAIWIGCALLVGLYLLGAFKLKHDSDEKVKLSVPRISFAILAFIFTIYMVPGLFGAPLNMLSGYMPPSHYREWKDPKDKFADCPNGMECYHDYDEGMCIAQQRNMPVMLDFTGYGCVNCRKMEDNVWIHNEIFKVLSQQLIVISLYVDDYSHKIPVSQRGPSLSDPNVTLKNYGEKWADFQRFYFGKNSQPQYVLLTPDGKLLNCDQAYTDKDTYLKWLEQGMCRWEKIKNNQKPVQ